MKKVYICSPFKGKTKEEVESNIELARRFSMHASKIGKFPMCPHIYLEKATGMSEENGDRKKLLRLGIQMLLMCDEMWICTKKISAGMKEEIKIAEKRHMKIREIWKTRAEYFREWVKKNPEKVRAIKTKYELKRKEARRLARIDRENNKYF